MYSFISVSYHKKILESEITVYSFSLVPNLLSSLSKK
jgi:hypothetical protein